MRLIFDDVALADLEDIFHWIAKDNPKAVKAVVERIFASVEYLASFPQMGRAGRDEGSFEWVVPRLPYIVVYEIHSERDEVIVVAVMHGAMDRGDGDNLYPAWSEAKCGDESHHNDDPRIALRFIRTTRARRGRLLTYIALVAPQMSGVCRAYPLDARLTLPLGTQGNASIHASAVL